MSSPSLALTFENDSSLAGRQLRWLVIFWNAFYLHAFILTLAAVLWNTPTPWGHHETALMVIVSLQVVLYIVFFFAGR